MTNELKALRERVAELQEQNAYLRESAVTFAQLAERLNRRLREERELRTLPVTVARQLSSREQ